MAVARRSLCRDRIVDVALELIDTDGIEALSMRKLGASLGVDPMSLYHHVANKDALLDAVLERLYSQVEVPEADEGCWKDQLRFLCHSLREVGKAHPNAFPLFASRSSRNPVGLDVLRRSHDLLLGAGFDHHAAIEGFHTASGFVIGFVLMEVSGLAREVGEAPAPPAGGASIPCLADFVAACSAVDHDRLFSAGLDVLICGLAARLSGTC